jgi:hypothetical protein
LAHSIEAVANNQVSDIQVKRNAHLTYTYASNKKLSNTLEQHFLFILFLNPNPRKK